MVCKYPYFNLMSGSECPRANIFTSKYLFVNIILYCTRYWRPFVRHYVLISVPHKASGNLIRFELYLEFSSVSKQVFST